MLISVYADGSSNGRSNAPIGWGFVVVNLAEETIVCAGNGGLPIGTNNQAEMLGAIEGLEAAIARGLHLTHSIELVSDSMYTLNMAADKCIPNTNHDLVNKLQTLFKAAKATARWVRGHSGEIINVQCDKLAKAARDALSPAKPIKKRRSKRQRQEQSRKRMLTKEYKANELVGI